MPGGHAVHANSLAKCWGHLQGRCGWDPSPEMHQGGGFLLQQRQTPGGCPS